MYEYIHHLDSNESAYLLQQGTYFDRLHCTSNTAWSLYNQTLYIAVSKQSQYVLYLVKCVLLLFFSVDLSSNNTCCKDIALVTNQLAGF